MDDRQLLEAAAKAAGLEDAKYQNMEGWGEVRYGFSEAIWSEKLGDYWNPLTDDGDALRLAVKLGLYVGGKFTAHQSVQEFIELGELAAVRRAIVRAAAALSTGAQEKS